MSKKAYHKNSRILLTGLFFIWLILFEFVIPGNGFLPKPSIVFLSFGSLIKDYHLWRNFGVTVSEIYFALIISYFVDWLLCKYITGNEWFFSALDAFYKLFKFLPAVILGMFLILWFPNSNFNGVIFSLLIFIIPMAVKVKEESYKVKPEYIDAATSLGAGKNELSKNVIWKAVQPSLLNYIFELHYLAWLLLIVFEFMKGGYGLGSIYRDALRYKDLSALFSISIITGITIFAGFYLLKYFKNKFIHWSNF
ncbi:MAG: ABC transporter permease [Ignavibacteriaceae bacterium]